MGERSRKCRAFPSEERPAAEGVNAAELEFKLKRIRTFCRMNPKSDRLSPASNRFIPSLNLPPAAPSPAALDLGCSSNLS
ncbi:hypothetical protein SDJN02_01127, partial [Cucurbita argyrosperma subsp. argyrosperma]